MIKRLLLALLVFFIPALAINHLDRPQNQTVLAVSNESSPYGMNLPLFWTSENLFPEDKWEIAIQRMAQAGVKFSRMTIHWPRIQPTKNSWNWEKHDKLIQLHVNKKISLLGYFMFAPGWAKKDPSCQSRWDGKICPPKTADWKNFIKKTVERYGCGSGGKCQIKYWEIWNEPNSDKTYHQGDCSKAWLCGDVNDYFEMLHQAYRTIKGVDPEAVVVMGGISQIGLGEKKFLGQLLRKSFNGQPCGDFFDVFNFHFYYHPQDPRMVLNGLESIGSLRTAYRLSTKPIWVTEVNRNKDHCTPLADAAQDQRRAITFLLREGTAKVFWFKLDSTTERECGYPGIVEKETFNKLQPLYQAYQDIAGVEKIPLGWSEISWPNIQGYTAKTALEEIDATCGPNTRAVIARKRKDFWQESVAGFGGNNFALQNNQGYFIKVGKDCSWTP